MTRWRCRSFQALLVDAAVGALDAPSQERLDGHLAQCAECTRELAALRELPDLLRAAAVPDPGEEFWAGQRQAIGRAIRNLPVPRPRWQLAWLRDALRPQLWRYPAALAASVLIALFVYRVAERVPTPPSSPPELQVATLDTGSLVALHDLMRALAPAEDYVPAYRSDEEIELASLEMSDLVGVSPSVQAPHAGELSDSDLEGIGNFLGDYGEAPTEQNTEEG